jgi:hypothetical protein
MDQSHFRAIALAAILLPGTVELSWAQTGSSSGNRIFRVPNAQITGTIDHSRGSPINRPLGPSAVPGGSGATRDVGPSNAPRPPRVIPGQVPPPSGTPQTALPR